MANSDMLKLIEAMIESEECISKVSSINTQSLAIAAKNIINTLKNDKKVDTYIPAKKKMTIYEQAIMIAKVEGKWSPHPNKKRKTQEIQLVKDLGTFRISENTKDDVEICACVVHDTKDDEYYVFMITDTTKTAKQIITTYELRPEIEEDYIM